MFLPDLLTMFFNPFYFSRKGLASGIQKHSTLLYGKTLDLGCGRMPYRELFSNSSLIGMDIHSPHNDKIQVASIFYDPSGPLPCQNNEYDNVFCSQVLEHVLDPGRFLDEINRILRVDGKLLITMPFIWGEHEQPSDYQRYTSFGLKNLIKSHGFEIISYHNTGHGITTLFQLTLSYIYTVTLRLPKVFGLPLLIILSCFLNITGSILYLILPVDTNLFLDHIVLAKKNT